MFAGPYAELGIEGGVYVYQPVDSGFEAEQLMLLHLPLCDSFRSLLRRECASCRADLQWAACA